MNYNLLIEKSKTDVNTLKINNYYIHSKYNPIRDSENIAEKYFKPHHLHILFGYGLGYVTDELIKKFKFNEPLLILDPLLDNELLTFRHENIKRVYRANLSNKELLSNLLSHLNSYSNKISIIICPNYDKIFDKVLSETLKIIKNAQIREIYNVNTINLFAETWQLNNLLGLENVLNDESVDNLKKQYNCPVVVAASGPSLSKQIDKLKIARDKFILICAGSTINVLLKHGLEPDYVVSVDGGLANYNHFKDLSLDYAELIYSTTNHYKIRDSFNSTAYTFIPKSFPTLSSYFALNFNKHVPEVNGGGSVAHYALSIAKMITSGPIALIGQDLAYTNGISHAEGNKHKIKIEETKQEKFEVEGYYTENGPVLTDNSFKTMIDTFEQMQLSEPHKNNVYNCTEGGAKIALYEQVAFELFLKQYCTSVVKRVVPKQNDNTFNINIEQILKKEFEGYEKIKQLLKEGILITNKEKGPMFNNGTLKKLSKIESNLKILYNKFNLDSLLEPIIIKNEIKFLPQLNETALTKFKRVKDYTITLYKDCINSIENFEEKILIEMENKND